MKRLSLLPLAAVAACALASCADDAPNGLDFSVREPGPFRVGYRTIEVTYTPPAAAERTITVALWYPVKERDARAIEAPEYAWYTIIRSATAIVDAPLAPPAYEDGYPLLVYSHGATSFPGNSYFVAETFASHGWVVAAPTHVGDTLLMVSTPTPLENRYERPLDVSATLDALAALPAEDPLSGQVVTDRAVLAGHSRGSFTIWAALGSVFDVSYVQGRCDDGAYDNAGGCPEAQIAAYGESYEEPRIVAGIPMAGSGDSDWFGGHAGMNGVTKPVLMLSGTLDPVGAQSLYENVTGPEVTWVEFTGGCHQLFGYGGCPELPQYEAQPSIDAYTLAFARHHLLGDDDPEVLGLLSGEIIPSDIVTFHP